jgi:hypothetical protein
MGGKGGTADIFGLKSALYCLAFFFFLQHTLSRSVLSTSKKNAHVKLYNIFLDSIVVTQIRLRRSDRYY